MRGAPHHAVLQPLGDGLEAVARELLERGPLRRPEDELARVVLLFEQRIDGRGDGELDAALPGRGGARSRKQRESRGEGRREA